LIIDDLLVNVNVQRARIPGITYEITVKKGGYHTIQVNSTMGLSRCYLHVSGNITFDRFIDEFRVSYYACQHHAPRCFDAIFGLNIILCELASCPASARQGKSICN
jgi:hypothetical protein